MGLLFQIFLPSFLFFFFLFFSLFEKMKNGFPIRTLDTDNIDNIQVTS